MLSLSPTWALSMLSTVLSMETRMESSSLGQAAMGKGGERRGEGKGEGKGEGRGDPRGDPR